MVLFELGEKINKALSNMSESTVIDEKAVDGMLKDIGNALISADVNVMLVIKLRNNIKKRINLQDIAAGHNKRKIIRQAVIDELCNLLDPGTQPFVPRKRRPNVVMFVGLQGAGKTTTVGKLAYYYKRKGWKPAVVCADTFRAGAFDQLKQNATKAKVPFYGSYVETDPVAVAQEGVAKFKKEQFDMIIVDTSGRHKQEEALFEEMQDVAAAVKPDQIIFVMDGSIGQAAEAQAKAFNDAVDVGSVIITKMDSKNRKGGGALSAVAATKSPIIFIGVGEHLDDLEPFVVRSFVSKLMGMGDMPELVRKISSVVDEKKQPKLVDRLKKGLFSLRDMHDQFESILQMGPLGKMLEMMPGMGNLAKQASASGVDSSQKIKIYMTMMDSMTNEELDNSDVLYRKNEGDSRVRRIARGSGRSISEVHELLDQYKHFEKMMTKMPGLAKGGMKKGGQMNPRNMQQLSSMLPPGMMQQMNKMGGMQGLMKQMGLKK